MSTTLRQERLADYINALRPIIYINHFDHNLADELIASVADGAKCRTFTNSGIFSGKERLSGEDKSLAGFLNDNLCYLDDASEDEMRHMFIIIKDAHHYFDEKSPSYSPECVALLKEIAQRTMFDPCVYATVFLVSPVLVLPREIEKMITVFDIPFPDNEEVERIIADYENSFGIKTDESVRRDLLISFKGLTGFEIRQILNYAYQQSGQFTEDSVKLVLKEKEQIIKKSGIIEIFTTNQNMDDIGGLENLKAYLENKKNVFSSLGEARKFGVDLPKGILIIGMPGCGKSLTAKATAGMFNVPLLRLDIGKLMGKYVGESEHNLTAAIKTAEAVAPCVLWIDELEKAFAGVGGAGGGSDITTRLFGHFLTWLQEKESSVYVVATANDITTMPPEFFRKGRFDELFLVELPDDDERRNIFKIHLAKRNQLSPQVDIIKLIKATEGYSGADIESVVKEAVEMAFCEGDRFITTDTLLDVIKNTKSITDTLGEKIKNLKEVYKKYSLKNANGEVTFPVLKKKTADVNARKNNGNTVFAKEMQDRNADAEKRDKVQGKGLPLIVAAAVEKGDKVRNEDFPAYLIMDGTVLNGYKKYNLPAKLVIPEGVTSIGQDAFCRCDVLKSVKIPGSVTIIKNRAFWNCRMLENVVISNGVKNIRENAFVGCYSLRNVKIPDSVTSIGDGAFSGCTRLGTVEIRKGVKSIGLDAFSDCERLCIYYSGTQAQWKEIVGSDKVLYTTVHCTDGDIILWR